MIRRFEQLDGTLDNVAQRITDDYTYHLGDCDEAVGNYAKTKLETKLSSLQFKTLGFTEDMLTLPLGEVEFSDESGITKLIDRITYDLVLDPSTDLAFLNGADALHAKTVSATYIKANMGKAIMRNSNDVQLIVNSNNKKYRRLLRKAGISSFVETSGSHYDKTLDKSVLRPLSNRAVTYKAFHTNTPCEETFNMKPSKWLAKYIEPLMEGVTAKYSALLSVNKSYSAFLTIDPTIMLNCSESATFSSCFRYEGEYHYTAQRFMNGLETAMLVAFDDVGRINYRCWTMIKENREALITLRSYADIPPSLIGSAMKKKLRTHVLGSEVYEKEILDECSNIEFEPDGDSYVDPGYVAFRGELDDAWYVNFGCAISPEDGNVTDDAELNSTRCDCCDERTHMDELYTVNSGYSNDERVCCYCQDNNYVYVSNRDEYYHNDVVVRVVSDEYIHEDDLCEYVEYKDEYYHVDDCTHTSEGIYIPDDFIDEDHAEIDGTYYPMLDLYYSESLDEWFLEDNLRAEAEDEGDE